MAHIWNPKGSSSICQTSYVTHTDPFDLVFGYREGIDARDGLVEVAPEMLVLPFWTRDMCDAIIRASEAAGGFEPNPDDPVPGHEISLATISPRLYENVMVDLGV